MHRRGVRAVGLTLLAGVVPLAMAACSSSHDEKAASLAPSAPAATNGAAGNSATTATTPVGVNLADVKRPASDRQVISTAELDLQARDIDAAVDRATTVVDDAGGYVFAESASLTAPPHAVVTFKVPPDAFAGVVARIGRLGTLVHRRIGTQDVTGRVVDLGARLQAAQTSADRLRELLASSGNLGDLLSVENQLTAREGQVDALASDLAALRAQVDMATITLDVGPLPKRASARAPRPGPGFQLGLRGGTHAFAATGRIVEAAVGVLLPFAPIALLAGVGWWLFRRRTAAKPSAL